MSHPRQINVTDDPDAMEIWGEIMEERMEGFVYKDGEVWADEGMLTEWRRVRDEVVLHPAGELSATSAVLPSD